MDRSWSTTRAKGRANLRRIYGPLSLDVSGRIILDLCGGTGAWSCRYAWAGYDVRIIDPMCGTGDVRTYRLPMEKIHGILAAPPCTVYSLARIKPVTEAELIAAQSVVDACIRIIFAANPAWWALENPRGRLIQYLGRPALSFNPCDYGDPWTKRTFIWGRFNPPERRPVPVVTRNFIQKVCPSGGLSVAQIRAITPPHFAKAFFEANP